MGSQRDFLLFNPNMVENVRREYNLDKPGVMDQSLEILESWIQKQEHFVKKDFPRKYLEGFLIASKGSVEKTKRRLDRLCTLRTMAPNLFQESNVKNDFPNMRECGLLLPLPEPTEDDCRIYVAKIYKTTVAGLLDLYQYHRTVLEFSKLHDYVKGYYVIMDFGDLNIIEGIAQLDLNDLRNVVSLCLEGHGVRLLGMYLISTSNMISALVNLLRPFLNAKIMDRIHVLKTAEVLHEVLPTKLLPKDYGGAQKDEVNEAMSTEECLAFYEEINRACTNENLRRSSDDFNQEYLGMPGSFKLLSVD